jgi:hypothetical protein
MLTTARVPPGFKGTLGLQNKLGLNLSRAESYEILW